MTKWELKDTLFSIEHMEKQVRDYAGAKNMSETLKALEIMKEKHAGQVRKGKDKVPYIVHPLLLACHAFALEIDSDNLIATCLLHDVVEDCGVEAEELDVNEEIREAVVLLTFKKPEGVSRKEAKAEYYRKISENKIASIVKILDRCNNISTMATGFTKEKMVSYIEETEEFVFPLMEKVKHEYEDYYNASFLLKYQICSLMETIKRLL